MSHEGHFMKKCLGILVAVLLTACMEISAYAVSDSVSISLPVSQRFVNHTTSEVENTFSYILTPLETGNPMPGQNCERYTFTMKGTEDVKLPQITFKQAGSYRYELRQLMKSEKRGYTFDGEIYTVEIYVNNSPEGRMTISTVAYRGDAGKTEQISFENSYQREESSAVSENFSQTGSSIQTGDAGNLACCTVMLIFAAAGFIGMQIAGRKRRC